MEIVCNNIENTRRLAIKLAEQVKDIGAFITLRGSIGVGKTAFTRFLLKEIGVQETITSPTFVILNEYHSENYIPIYHFDLYRLEHVGLKTIMPEIEEYSSGNNLTLVEWADFGEKELPYERLDINIEHGTTNNSRIFKINAFGQKAENILKGFTEEWEKSYATSCI